MPACWPFLSHFYNQALCLWGLSWNYPSCLYGLKGCADKSAAEFYTTYIHGWRHSSIFVIDRCYGVLNWCPVIASRQQVSPILSLAVISLLIDQWDDLLHFKLSVGCSYDILLIFITKAKRVLRKKKQIHTEILYSCWFHGILNSHESSARSSTPFLHSSELHPLDHAYPVILVDGQDFDRLD